MNINKNNYEAFFLDYHEGNLTPQQVADLFLFIEQHPELKEEFDNFESITLDDVSSIKFENKSSLKKEIAFDNREEYFIRAVENTLSTAEIILLDNFLKQYPQFLVELELFRKTKLSVDNSIVFENKNGLKKVLSSGTFATPQSKPSSNSRSPFEEVISQEITDENERMLIGAIEGLLTKEEMTLLNEQILVDASIRKDYRLFQQIKFAPDSSIVFKDKEKLKHKNRKGIPLYYYISVAAAFLFLFGLFFLFNTKDKNAEFSLLDSGIKNKELKSIETPVLKEKKRENNLVKLIGYRTSVVKKVNPVNNKNTEVPLEPATNQATVVLETYKKENKEPFVTVKDSLLNKSFDTKQTSSNADLIVQVEKKNEPVRQLNLFLCQN